LERVDDAVGTGGVVEDVAAALGERVDDVRGLAVGDGGEVYRRGGGLVWESGGDGLDVVADGCRLGGRLEGRDELRERGDGRRGSGQESDLAAEIAGRIIRAV